MDTMWEKIKKGLIDGATLSIEKIEEYTKLGKLKVEELAAKRKIERNFVDIGERVFDLTEEGKGAGASDDLAIKKAIENISALREEIADINRQMKEINENAKKNDTSEEEDDDINGI